MGETSRSLLYSDLIKFSQSSDYERTLKTANKVLHNYPDDQKAFQFRIISLIHLSKFEEALLAFTKFKNHDVNMEFEKAYCLYRLNRTEEALNTLSCVKDPSLRVRELLTQVYYRLERFEECFDAYRDIIKNSNDDYEEERKTNMAAVIANICIHGKEIKMPDFGVKSYEITYNTACQMIGNGQYLKAERTLRLAEKICRESSYEEGAPEDDDDIGILKIQQAYCAHMLGREKEAQAIYNDILKNRPLDPGLVAVVCNNSVAINRDQNLFDSKKKIKSALLQSVQYKLTTRQKRTIAINNCLLNIYTTQGLQAIDLCNKLIAKFPEAGEFATLMKAVIHNREHDAESAITVLKEFAKVFPESKLAMNLAIAQILLSQGKVPEVCKVLECLGDDTYKPGIVSALVTLHLEVGEAGNASNILQRAVNWHKKNKTTTGDLSALWRHAADLHLRGGQPEVAARSLEELLKINPRDSTTLAQLIIAYAQFDPIKAKSLSSQLPNLVDLTPNIDIETLEASNWMMGIKVIKRAAKGDPSPGTPGMDQGVVKKRKINKNRKGPLPKNYDSNVDPDPERWLPRHERSTFRKKKDRRNRDVGKGTQGAATHASDQFDITKMASSQKSAATLHTSPVPEGPRQQQRKVQKKKRKGGK